MHHRYTSLRSAKLIRSGAGSLLNISEFAWSGTHIVEMTFRASDYTPAANRFLVRDGQTDGDLAWSIQLLTTGALRANFYPAGTLASEIGKTSANIPPFVNGSVVSVRVSMLPTIFGAVSAYIFDWRINGVWTLGAIETAAIVAVPIFNSTQNTLIGEMDEITDLYDATIRHAIFGVGQESQGADTDAALRFTSRLYAHYNDTFWETANGEFYAPGAGAQFALNHDTDALLFAAA